MSRAAASSGLGGEYRLVGHAGQKASFLVAGPVLWQVQGAVEDRVPQAGSEGQMDSDLAHPDPAQSTGVLGPGADRIRGGLLVPGLVRDKHTVAVVECFRGPGRRLIEDGPLVPHGAREQVLEPVRAPMPQGLGQRPAVRILQLHQQALGHLPKRSPGLPAGKAASRPAHQVLEPLSILLVRYGGRGTPV